MNSLWRRLKQDESGFVISSELVLVGTVCVVGMVVGLEAVSSAVNNEMNDLAHAFGAVNQSYNYRSIAKVGHARVSGSGFNDAGDFCDCAPIVQTEVGGTAESAVIVQPSVAAPVVAPPAVREQVIQERVIDEVIVEEAPVKVAPKVCCEGEIIEEHIIRRRIHPDCSPLKLDCAAPPLKREILPEPDAKPLPPEPKSRSEKAEPKPKPKKKG